MPYTAEFIDNGRGLQLTGHGIVTAADIKNAKKGLAHEALKNVRYAICDLRTADDLKVSMEEMREIARLDMELSRIIPDAVVALVAPRTDIYGLSRMWQTLVEDTKWPTAIFLSREEADRWVQGRAVQV